MSKETIIVKVDSKNLNATHFAKMDKDKAVERMQEDGISSSKEWCEKAYDACYEAVHPKPAEESAKDVAPPPPQSAPPQPGPAVKK